MNTQARKHVYISYSRRSKYEFIHELIVASKDISFQRMAIESENQPPSLSADFDNKDPVDVEQWIVLYDENALKPGGSISTFMEKLSEGYKIIILLSPGYFQSIFCVTELLHIYYKRSHEPLPIVVFVDSYKPTDIKPDELINYWRQERNETENKPEKQQLCERFINELPGVLDWLLGEYNEAHENWDILVEVVSTKNPNAAVAKNVLSALETTKKPRFAIVPWQRRARIIKTEITEILNHQFLEELSAKLKTKSAVSQVNGEDCTPFSEGQIDPLRDDFCLIACLDAMSEWLKKDVLNHPSSHQRTCLVTLIEELLGWLLLSAVDDRKLRRLIHRLNRGGDTAAISLIADGPSAYQILVATVAQVPVLYTYELRETHCLVGKGQWVLNDAGIDTKNRIKKMENEQDWMQLKNRLLNSVKFASQQTPDAATGALRAFLRSNKGQYLLFDRKELNEHCFMEIRDYFGKKHPNLCQVVGEESGENTTQSYYPKQIDSGGLDLKIQEIYSLLYQLKLTHQTGGNSG